MADQKAEKYLYSFIWIVFLVVIGWPVAYFCAAWWVFFIPFEGLFAFVRDITEFLEKLMSWPRDIGQAVLDSRTSFPRPW